MFGRFAIMHGACVCFGGGAGLLGAATTDQWKLALAAGIALTAGSLWFARLIWRVASDRQHVLSKICAQADRIQNLSAGWENQVLAINTSVTAVKDDVIERMETIAGGIGKRCERHEAIIAGLSRKQANHEGRCEGRAEMYEKMGEHLQAGS